MRHFAARVLVALMATVALGGCGTNGITSDPLARTSPAAAAPTATATNTGAPRATPTPASFTGTFAGTATLDAGRTAAVSLTVQSDTTATGTLTISGGTSADVVVPLTGFADLIGGSFSLSGDSDTVSGTLPAASGSGFLSVQIGSNTTPFHGTIGAATSSAPTFERIQAQVFNVSCSSDSCHSSVGRAGNLVLQAGQSWDALVNHPASNPVAAEQGLMRVKPGDPNTSFLMAKVADNLAAGEGLSMPYGVAPLDASTVDVLRAWIAAGAPVTGVVPGDNGQPLGGGGDTPGTIDLPPPIHGVQLHVTSPPVAKGTEETGCHYFKLPSDVDFDVNRFQIAVSGGSHHIHLYRAYDPTLDLPDGYEVCNHAVDFDVWELVVATQIRHSDWELSAGVGYHFRAGEQLLIQTHFVNVGSLETIGEGQAAMNLNAADAGSITAYAGAIFGQNKDVDVPPFSNPTADAECVFPNAINLMAETGHYHFRGRHFQTFLWDNGQRGVQIYDYQGYDDPPFTIHNPPVPFAPGQGLQWECYWENPTGTDFPFGPFTATNEHCNWFGFYYPTSSQNEAITCVKQHGVSTTTVRGQH